MTPVHFIATLLVKTLILHRPRLRRGWSKQPGKQAVELHPYPNRTKPPPPRRRLGLGTDPCHTVFGVSLFASTYAAAICHKEHPRSGRRSCLRSRAILVLCA